MVTLAHVDNLSLTQLMRWSRRVRSLALGVILLLMLALFLDFHRAGMIYARTSLMPSYLLFLAASYAVCIFVECLTLWWGHEKGFYCARTLVHATAMVVVAGVMGAFFISGGAARVGMTHAALDDAVAATDAAKTGRSYAGLPASY
jgi:fatty acid desaturase